MAAEGKKSSTPQSSNVTEADMAESDARKAFMAQYLTASNVDPTNTDLKTPVSPHGHDAPRFIGLSVCGSRSQAKDHSERTVRRCARPA